MAEKVNRRAWIAGAGAAVGAAALPAEAAASAKAAASVKPVVKDSKLDTMDVTSLQAEMAAGRLTSQALLRHCLQRIQAIDQRGPRLNAVIQLNPEAQALAQALDAERRGTRGTRGQPGRVRGPLHGTVAVLKDIIGTGDKMHNTGGAKALRDAQSDRDAFAVKRLRDAGVVEFVSDGKTVVRVR
jgi:amidase